MSSSRSWRARLGARLASLAARVGLATDTTFDAAAYWRQRTRDNPGLQGTGTSFMPEAWQRSLYRAKERAFADLLGRNHVALRGARVLNFGCGTGYFEDVWERAGAAALAGVDVVPEAIERLAHLHPERRYVCADLAHDADALRELAPCDLVTAIDVLYHVVDDEDLARALSRLLQHVRPGGAFLFTDALTDERPAPHVRFRSELHWRRVLAASGFRVVDREPVAFLHNRPSLLGRLAPASIGALQLHADAAVRRVFPTLANNWAVVAVAAEVTRDEHARRGP